MALWFEVRLNREGIGLVEVRRREPRDLTSPGIDETVNTYDVRLDGQSVGAVRHRYGDKAWRLAARSLALIAEKEAP